MVVLGVFSNRLLLWGIALELAFAAAVIYLPPLHRCSAPPSLNALDVAPLLASPCSSGAATNFADRQCGGASGRRAVSRCP